MPSTMFFQYPTVALIYRENRVRLLLHRPWSNIERQRWWRCPGPDTRSPIPEWCNPARSNNQVSNLAQGVLTNLSPIKISKNPTPGAPIRLEGIDTNRSLPRQRAIERISLLEQEGQRGWRDGPWSWFRLGRRGTGRGWRGRPRRTLRRRGWRSGGPGRRGGGSVPTSPPPPRWPGPRTRRRGRRRSPSRSALERRGRERGIPLPRSHADVVGGGGGGTGPVRARVSPCPPAGSRRGLACGRADAWKVLLFRFTGRSRVQTENG